MLNIEGVTIKLGDRQILDTVNLNMFKNEKIGLVGVNGAGKSTLLKCIAGFLEPDLGSINFNGSMTYLSQEINKKVDELNGDMTIAEYLIVENGLDIEEWEINKMINHLHIEGRDSDSFFYDLSGGQKIKVELIRVLLSKSDLLILDEPTNFLDIASSEWLMSYLMEYPGAVLVVSHDLRLMNKALNKIWFLNERTLNVEVFVGNYTKFLELKMAIDEHVVRQIRNQERRVKKVRDSAIVLSGRKSEKEKRKAARKFAEVEKLKEEIREKNELLRKSKRMRLSRGKITASSMNVLSVSNLSKSYVEGIKVLRDVNVDIYRGERVAIIGKNGVGKTTLLKVLAGKLKQDTGKVDWGHGVNIGYYSQEYEDLDYSKSVIENIVVEGLTTEDVRRFLGSFLITGDMAEQRVASLSGGEKTRLALAKILIRDLNVLLLDEPTTYLDPASQDVLLDFLRDYPGTILLVSHSPSFVEAMDMDKVLLMPEERYTYYEDKYLDVVGIT